MKILIVLLFSWPLFFSSAGEKIPSPTLDEIYAEAAEQFQVPQALLKAVCRHESGHNPLALGRAGEIGMCQILPSTGKGECGVGRGNLWDAGENARCAALYLARQKKIFGDWEKAVMAYNIGPGNMMRGKKLARGRRYLRMVLSKIEKPGTETSFVLRMMHSMRNRKALFRNASRSLLEANGDAVAVFLVKSFQLAHNENRFQGPTQALPSWMLVRNTL